MPGALSCKWETVPWNKKALTWKTGLDSLRSVKHSCYYRSAMGSHREKRSHQAEGWEETRAQGFLKQQGYGNPRSSRRELQKALRAQADGAKAQQFSKCGFLWAFRCMWCYCQDLWQWNDWWLQKQSCACLCGLGLHLRTKAESEVITSQIDVCPPQYFLCCPLRAWRA